METPGRSPGKRGVRAKTVEKLQCFCNFAITAEMRGMFGIWTETPRKPPGTPGNPADPPAENPRNPADPPRGVPADSPENPADPTASWKADWHCRSGYGHIATLSAPTLPSINQ